MRAVHCLAAAALVLGAVGCAVPKGAGFPDVAKAVEKRAGLQVHWRTGTEEDQKADKLVTDLLEKELSADDAVQIALLRNPTLQATYEALGVAQADVVQAGLLENPRFSVAVRFPLMRGLRLVDMGVTESFLSAFLIPAKKRMAEARFELAKLQVSHAILEQATRTRVAYLRLVSAKAELTIATDALDRAAASVKQASPSPADVSNKLPVAAERAAYEAQLVDVARLEGATAEAREDLLVEMGLFGPDADHVKVPATIDEVPEKDPSMDGVEGVAVASRFDLAAARRTSEIAARALDLAKMGRYTSILDLGIATSREEDGTWFLGPSGSLTLPIFDQGQALIFSLESRKRGADERLFALSIEARSEARRQRGRVLLSRDLAERTKAAWTPVAARVVALAEQQHDTSLLGVLQIAAARREESAARRAHVTALRDYWIARAELVRAVGGALP